MPSFRLAICLSLCALSCSPPAPTPDDGGSGTGGATGGAAGGGSGAAGAGGQPAVKALGATCSSAGECVSGFCADGVCCNTACTGLCEVCGGNDSTGTAGTCSPVAAGVDPANECDADAGACRADTCDGQGACTAVADGTVCRGPNGSCDVPEVCAAGVCPADGAAAVDAGTVCRAAAGVCDTEERCDGVSKQCPVDVLAEENTRCRNDVGACDSPEVCTGSSPLCPADAFLDAGTLCRASAGVCDVAESCTGSSAACPADLYVNAGTVCRDAGAECDAPEECTGTQAACPVDGFRPSSTACGQGNMYRCTGVGGVCRTSCSSDNDCNTTLSGVTCRDAKKCHNGKWAFVTSTTHAGNLGGLAGANALCTARAADGGISGAYKAWLGDSSQGPSVTFQPKSNVPHYLVNGTKLVDSWTDLSDGTLDVAFNVNEFGQSVGTAQVWTGVVPNGGFTLAAQSCSNWTTGDAGTTAAFAGRYGVTNNTGEPWSFENNQLAGCNTPRRLYCFEQ